MSRPFHPIAFPAAGTRARSSRTSAGVSPDPPPTPAPRNPRNPSRPLDPGARVCTLLAPFPARGVRIAGTLVLPSGSWTRKRQCSSVGRAPDL